MKYKVTIKLYRTIVYETEEEMRLDIGSRRNNVDKGIDLLMEEGFHYNFTSEEVE